MLSKWWLNGVKVSTHGAIDDLMAKLDQVLQFGTSLLN
jgi:hypothetical protein